MFPTKVNPGSHGIGVARVKERLYETDKCRVTVHSYLVPVTS